MLVEKILNFVEQIHKKRIVNYLKEKSIKAIIDVGAHKGEFINCSLEIKSVEKIFAFEPQKKIFEFLKKKFLDNKKFKFPTFHYEDRLYKNKSTSL